MFVSFPPARYLWLCTLLAVGCRPTPAPAPASTPGEVRLARAAAASAGVATRLIGTTEIGAKIVIAGRVTYDDVMVQHVFSPVSGKVTRVCAEPGQRVRAGDALAELASPDLGTAASDVDKARADLAAASADLHRQKQLCAQGAASHRDLELAEDTHSVAATELARAEEKARLLGSRRGPGGLQQYTLRASLAGEVISRNIALGTELQGQYGGGNGAELFTIANLDAVWVLGDLYEVDVGRVHVGQAVQVRVPAYPDVAFDGHLEWVADVLDPNLRTAKLRCTIANPDGRLKPDMFATVSIAASGAQALTVPRSAVVHMGDKTVVFVEAGDAAADSRRFLRRPVIIDEDDEGPAASSGDRAEVPVLHGLAAGEAVVVGGADRLAEAL